MWGILEWYDIDSKCLVVIKLLLSKLDIKKCLELVDIYLDFFFYGGVIFLLDFLMLGLLLVVVEGNVLRFR